jgi:tRNA pseudouridine38-40 synthase
MTVAYALLVEYDGAPFHGWQRQAGSQRGAASVQEALEQAAARLARGAVATIVAGRTDAGVHAEGQVVALELEKSFPVEKLAAALNYHLRPHPIAVLRAVPAPAGWNPRFSAISRVYRYRILNRPAPPALAAGRVWHLPQTLDVAAMAEAARPLLGRHDFSAFRAAGCQASGPLRTLARLEVRREGAVIAVTAEARSFLYHQVRNIVGSLKLVGEGRWEKSRIEAVLAARDRRLAGPTAPAAGLALVSVLYPSDPFASLSPAEQEPGHDQQRRRAEIDQQHEHAGAHPAEREPVLGEEPLQPESVAADAGEQHRHAPA